MEQIVNYVTCFAAVGLFFATCALVKVTIHHAHFAEKMAAAADRLGEILNRMATSADRLGETVDRQGRALAEVTELNALVSAMAALHMNMSGRGAHQQDLTRMINELDQRRRAGAEDQRTVSG